MDNGEIPPQGVRRKSSHRKQRADAAPRVRKGPSQDRSRQRREVILAAAEELLETIDIEALSHSEIARVAKVSKPSVHYHFPTISALQYELGRRADAGCTAVLRETRADLMARGVNRWQDWNRIEATAARDWFNAHRPACEALLGPLLTRENRVAGMRDNERVGMSRLEAFDLMFEIPNRDMVVEFFARSSEIYDLFWSASYQQNGRVDDEALEESILATTGYLRNVLPEVLPLKPRGG